MRRFSANRSLAAAVTVVIALALASAPADAVTTGFAMSNVEGAAPVAHGPDFPPPGGATFSRSGQANAAGGVTYQYSNLNLAAFSQVAWGLDGQPVYVSMEGAHQASDDMTFNSAQSNLAHGDLVWTGSTTVTGLYHTGPVATELRVHLSDATSAPAPFLAQATLPAAGSFDATLPPAVGDIGAIAPFPSNGAGNLELHANLQFLAGIDSPSESADAFFDSVHHTGSSASVQSSVGAGSYWTSAASASLSPSATDFGGEPVGGTSATTIHAVLTSNGPADLHLDATTPFMLTGDQAADFAIANSTCTAGAVLAQAQTCGFDVTFSPQQTGTRGATVSVNDNTLDTPQTFAVTGLGTAPAASLTPQSIDYGDVPVGTSSQHTVTVTSANDGTLHLDGTTPFAISGTNADDFAVAPGGTCEPGEALPAGDTCTVEVSFTPGASGARSASLQAFDDAADSPQALPLTGIGTLTQLTFSPSGPMDFGMQAVGTTSATRTLHVTDTGAAPLNIADATFAGDVSQFDIAPGAGCNGPIPPNGSCDISLDFKPSGVGAKSMTITLSDNAADSPQTYVLTGRGALVSTVPSAGVIAGGAISDTATLSGGVSPSGTITFDLFRPSDPNCSRAPVVEHTKTMHAGSASSGPVPVTAAGTYHWVATYNGDIQNNPVSSSCGEATAVTAAGLDHLSIQPGAGSMVAGGSRVFHASGYDVYGNRVGDVTADTTFSIAPDGSCSGASCTATVAGEHTVTGTDGAASGTATLDVDSGEVDHLVLSPASASITAGGSQVYTAEGFDSFGNSVGDVSGDTSFSIDPDGSCSGATCSAVTAGEHTVTGTDGTADGTAPLSVEAGALDHLALSPDTATIAAGEWQPYTAEGFDAYGNSLGDATVDTSFSIDGYGSCTDIGCGSSTAGDYTVTGTDGAAGGTAALRVDPAALDQIVLSPASATIAAGESQPYTAEGFDHYGNSRGDVSAATSFSIDGAGTCTGTSCGSTVAGDGYTVTGTDAGVSATAGLDVQAAALDHLLVSPAAGRITAGHARSFDTTAFDAYGNSRGDVSAATTLTVDNGGTCTANSCTITTTGAHIITATYAAHTASATLQVVAAPLDHIVVSPPAPSVVAGATRTFQATAFDQYGNSRGIVTTATTFTIDGSGCTGSSCGATTAGQHTIIATYNTHTATAGLRVTPAALDHLTLNPPEASIVAGGSRTYHATGVDQYGNSRGNLTSTTTFTIDGSDGACTPETCTGSRCTANTCTATAVGTHTITGTYPNRLHRVITGTATLTVRPVARATRPV